MTTTMTIRLYLKNLGSEVKNFGSYFRAVFTDRAVVISLCVAFGGILGVSLATILRIGAFFAWGTITLPYTASPLTVSALAFFGGLAGLVVSQTVAAHRFFHPKKIEDQSLIVKNRKFPFALPAGTTWNQIIFQFHDDENAIIRVSQFRHTANYIELGLYDGRGKQFRPSEQWHFLKVLAKLNGELSFADAEAKDGYKKQKQILSQKLKAYFGLDYDPFLPYSEAKLYRIKMRLIPSGVEPEAMPEIADKSDDASLEIRSYHAEQIAPVAVAERKRQDWLDQQEQKRAKWEGG